jgi:hypothetical protein
LTRSIKAALNDLTYHVNIGNVDAGFEIGNGLKKGDWYPTFLIQQ